MYHDAFEKRGYTCRQDTPIDAFLVTWHLVEFWLATLYPRAHGRKTAGKFEFTLMWQ